MKNHFILFALACALLCLGACNESNSVDSDAAASSSSAGADSSSSDSELDSGEVSEMIILETEREGIYQILGMVEFYDTADIFDVRFDLKANGVEANGAIHAKSVQDIKENGQALNYLEIGPSEDGIPGLGAEIHLSEIENVCQGVDDSVSFDLSVTALALPFNNPNSGDTVSYEMSFYFPKFPCPDVIKNPDPVEQSVLMVD